MSVPGYAHGIQMSFLATMNARAHAARLAKAADTVQTVQVTPSPAARAASASTASANTTSDSSFLSDVLDVINPLQHIPVVSTIYRAATGDKIGDVERVAGDTLYGGLIGLGSSLANIVFRDVTGKDFGDTALAWLGVDGTDGKGAGAAPTALASTATPTDKPAAQTTTQPATKPATKLAEAAPAQSAMAPAAVTPAQATSPIDPAAIMAALKAKGIDPALGLRALSAYRNMLGLSETAKATANAQH